MVPGGDYDQCTWYKMEDDDPHSPGEMEDLDEVEEIEFISTLVKNAEQYLNLKGIVSLNQWGIQIKIMTDDMVNFIKQKVEDGSDPQWAEIPIYSDTGSPCFQGIEAGATLIASSAFALSTLALTILN